VVLIVWEQFLWSQAVQRTARRFELGEDNLRRDRMALIEVDG
jgi:hypothetical protein